MAEPRKWRAWITNIGRERIAGLAVGEELVIDRIDVGTGNIFDTDIEPAEITELIAPVVGASMTRTDPVRVGAEIFFTAQYRSDLNKGIPEFLLGEFGFFNAENELLIYATMGDFPELRHEWSEDLDAIQDPPFSAPISIPLQEGINLSFNFPANVFVTHDEVIPLFAHPPKLMSDEEVHGVKFEVVDDAMSLLMGGNVYPLGGAKIDFPLAVEYGGTGATNLDGVASNLGLISGRFNPSFDWLISGRQGLWAQASFSGRVTTEIVRQTNASGVEIARRTTTFSADMETATIVTAFTEQTFDVDGITITTRERTDTVTENMSNLIIV